MIKEIKVETALTWEDTPDGGHLPVVDPYEGSGFWIMIKSEYRGQGIGEALLSKCIEWANNQGMKRIHVDFEPSNLYGNKFWQKYFSPLIYTVKRRINQDVLSAAGVPDNRLLANSGA